MVYYSLHMHVPPIQYERKSSIESVSSITSICIQFKVHGDQRLQ